MDAVYCVTYMEKKQKHLKQTNKKPTTNLSVPVNLIA